MAVYTHIPEPELRDLLKKYDIGEYVACKAIEEGVENSNYILDTGRGHYILTVYEKRVKANDLPFFLGLMEHLSGNRIPCPLPIHDKEGAVLQETQGKPLSIVTLLPGKGLKQIKTQHCAELGSMLAKMHLASKEFRLKRENALSLKGWKELYDKSESKAESVDGLDIMLVRSALNHVSSEWPKGLPAGVIHADLFPDNALFMEDKLTGVIDFYFACNDLFAYDIAICINAWCFEQGAEFNITKTIALLAGYNQVRAISEKELQALPILCTGAALRFLMSRLYDWLHPVPGAIVKPKDPMEYYKKLKFHRQVKNHSEYGL